MTSPQATDTTLSQDVQTLMEANRRHLTALAKFNHLVEIHGEDSPLVQNHDTGSVDPACRDEVAAERALLRRPATSLQEAKEKAVALLEVGCIAIDGDALPIILSEFQRWGGNVPEYHPEETAMSITDAAKHVQLTQQTHRARLREFDRLAAIHGEFSAQARDFEAREVHPAFLAEIAAEEALAAMRPETLADAGIKAVALLGIAAEDNLDAVESVRQDFDRLCRVAAA